MTQHRMRALETRDPFVHDIPSIRCDGRDVAVALHVRCDEQGMWRGRLVFRPGGAEAAELSTAEIFCATSERDLLAAATRLGAYHTRDLYRSLR